MQDDILPELRWVYSESPEYCRRTLTCVFRDWHRAKLLGLEVVGLELAGNKKTAEDLRRLNFWIESDGAWRASALPYWQGRGLLNDVLSGELGREFVGPAGGGRSAPATVLPLRWFQPQHFQRELGLALKNIYK